MSEKTSEKRSGWQVLGSWTRELAIVIVGAMIASTLLRLFLLQMFNIPSGSMQNTLDLGDRVAVQKIAGFQRGDVVVFEDTQNWLRGQEKDPDTWQRVLSFIGLAPDESKSYLVKRVIGMPGDRVVCCDAKNMLTVNGTPIDESAYLYTDPITGQQVEPSDVEFDLTVPADRIFVIGDHRNDSEDSRYHLCEPSPGMAKGMRGFVPIADVVGSGIAVVYPFSHWHGVGRIPSFDTVAPGMSVPPKDPVVNKWPELPGC